MTNLFKPLLLLLLTLSFLSSNIAHAKWTSDTNGCKVWVDGKDNNKLVKWLGQCRDGYSSGKGKIEYHSIGPNKKKSCIATMVKGKMQGLATCIRNNGDTISGKMENSNFVGEIVYTWKKSNCGPHCYKKYKGTLYKDNLAVGTITLNNGEKRISKQYPSKEGCLIWNEEPQLDEKISWSGGCKNGYGDGKGILIYQSSKYKQVLNCTLKGGSPEGYATMDASFTHKCDQCYVHQEGIFSFGRLIKGVSVLANGKKVEVDDKALNNAMLDVIGAQYIHMYLNNIYE